MQHPAPTLPAVARNPLVLAVAFLLAGITLGAYCQAPIALPLLGRGTPASAAEMSSGFAPA